MTAPFDWINDELSQLKQQTLLRDRLNSRPINGGKVERDRQLLWNFSSNDYLGLADDPRLIEAAHLAATQYGAGARASALVSGRTPIHVELEEKIAQFKHVESALLFPTGFAANVGTIGSLVGSEDVVLCDRLNHASLIDGCRISKAKLKVYPHNDAQALDQELERSQQFRRKLIVTDTLFSMDGDLAPLQELVNIADRHHAMLLVDEAHATGVFGANGAGLCEREKVDSNHIVNVGTFSKALGAQGGFVAGSQELIDWIWNSARPQMFSTALAPPLCGAILAALEIVTSEPHRRTWLHDASQHVQTELRSQGWDVPNQVVGPIIPVMIGEAERTVALGRELQQAGILVATIRPPTVPKQTSRLRISLTHAHGDAGVEALIKAFRQLRSGTAD